MPLLPGIPFSDGAAPLGYCMPLPHGGRPHQNLPWLPAEPASGSLLPLTASSIQSDRIVRSPQGVQSAWDSSVGQGLQLSTCKQ